MIKATLYAPEIGLPILKISECQPRSLGIEIGIFELKCPHQVAMKDHIWFGSADDDPCSEAELLEACPRMTIHHCT